MPSAASRFQELHGSTFHADEQVDDDSGRRCAVCCDGRASCAVSNKTFVCELGETDWSEKQPRRRGRDTRKWSAHKNHGSGDRNATSAPPSELPKKTELMEPRFPRRCIMWSRVQQHGHCPGCKSCHGLLGGHSDACRSRFERIWADADSFRSSVATTSKWIIVKFGWTSTSGKLIISG